MFLDTSVVVEFFTGRDVSNLLDHIPDAIDDEELYISLYQMAEIADWCHGCGLDPIPIIRDLREVITVVTPTEETMLRASRTKQRQRSVRPNFGIMDASIHSTAMEMDELLLTFDRDFAGLDRTVVIERPE